MMQRTQVSLDPAEHRQARRRAAELGISLAEYIRRLVRRDLEGPAAASPDVTGLFGLGDSGGSDVARHRDEYVADAIGDRRRR
jgi:hypothetical protein